MIKISAKNNKIIIFLFFILSCSSVKDNDDVVLARVGKKKLFFKNLPTQLVKPGMNKKDISVFVNTWVNNQVLFGEAKKEGFLNDRVLKEKTEKYYKDLVISSFIETKTSVVSEITKKAVLTYYNNNKSSFIRKKDGVFARHFLSGSLDSAKKIKNQLSRTKKSFNVDKYLKDSGYIQRGTLSKEINDLIFNSKQPLVGPVFFNKKHHIFEVVSRYKKGSFFGLEDVHDEIYQRLIKKVNIKGTSLLLDSLKRESDVFINLNY